MSTMHDAGLSNFFSHKYHDSISVRVARSKAITHYKKKTKRKKSIYTIPQTDYYKNGMIIFLQKNRTRCATNDFYTFNALYSTCGDSSVHAGSARTGTSGFLLQTARLSRGDGAFRKRKKKFHPSIYEACELPVSVTPFSISNRDVSHFSFITLFFPHVTERHLVIAAFKLPSSR